MFERKPARLVKTDVGSQYVEILAMSTEQYDWGLKEAVEIVEFLSKSDGKSNWEFTETIDSAIEGVEAEQKAQREREAAEKAQLERARQKAMTVRDKVILPLLNDLCDDFAADEKGILPEWQVQSDEETDLFSGVAATPDLDASRSTYFTIKAEASVVEGGEFVNLSVVCSSPNSKSASATQLAPLFHKTTKFPTVQKFEELGGRTWLHEQLAECARMCILTKMRQSPTSNADCVPRVLVDV